MPITVRYKVVIDMIEKYIKKSVQCKCGKVHRSRVETIVIKDDAASKELMDFLMQNGYGRITVVCDKNGYRAAGEKVCRALDKTDIQYKLHLFNKDSLAPDEYAVGSLTMGILPDSDIILAVGSGTVNDLCRYVSAVAGKPFCTVGTAPSMDGYISGGSALIYNNLKLTFETHPPKAVFFEPHILANAPKDMIASGVGDLLGKISCLTDWKLSEMITGEWHCDFISDTVDTAIQKTISCKDKIAAGDSDAVSTLLEALLLSGVCMDYAGNSRPASGCEHHLSHFWEMRFLSEGRAPVFHGTKVGIGTVISLKAYEYIADLDPDFAKIRQKPRASFAVWEKAVRKAFLDASEEIIDLEKRGGKNNTENLKIRLSSIEENWNKVKSLASNVTRSEVVIDILKKLGAPVKPNEIGIEKEMTRQAIMYAKEIRNRYTVLQLLWDLDELENFADFIVDQYYTE